MNDRAKMFLSFDALNINDYITKKEDKKNHILSKIKSLKNGKNIHIKYFDILEVKEVYGILKKIDYNKKCLHVNDSTIYFDDIVLILK